MTKLLLIFSLITSSIYIYDSGDPQPSHISFIIFFVAVIIRHKFRIHFPGARWTYALLFFFSWIAVSCLAWAIVGNSSTYLNFFVYTSFNIVLLFSLSSYLLYNSNGRGASVVSGSMFFAIVLLCAFGVLGIGRFNFFPRYNAFFNDPNQMAHWVICAYAVIVLLVKDRLLFKVMLACVCTYLVALTQSRSGFAGLLFVLCGVAIQFINTKKVSSNSKIVVLGSQLVISALFVVSIIAGLAATEIGESYMNRYASTDFGAQAEQRGYDLLLDHPKFLILGAGKAGSDISKIRFRGVAPEIHSTPAAMLFYWGIPGFFGFFGFIFLLLKNLRSHEIVVAVAPLAYSLTTFNARTPIFWVLLSVCVYLNANNRRKIAPQEVCHGIRAGQN